MTSNLSNHARYWAIKMLSSEPVLTITIPDNPPSNNHYKGVNGKHWFVRPAAKKFIALAQKAFYETAPHWRPLAAPLAVYMSFWVSAKSSLDLDNYPKVLNDSFNGLIWHDDSQVTYSMSEKILITPPRGKLVRDIKQTIISIYI